MRKLLSLPFKYAAIPFVFFGVVLLILSSLIRNGWDKTDKKLDEVNEMFEGEGKK